MSTSQTQDSYSDKRRSYHYNDHSSLTLMGIGRESPPSPTDAGGGRM